MPSVKALLYKNYKSKDATYPIVIRIIDGKKQKHHPTGYKVSSRHWDGSEVKGSHPDAALINAVILKELTQAKNYIADCKMTGKPFNIQNVFSEQNTSTLAAYMRKRAQQYYDAGQVVMKSKVERYLNDLQNCYGRDLTFDEFTPDNVHRLNVYLIQGRNEHDPKKKPNGANTRLKKFSYYAQYYREATGLLKTPFDNVNIQADPVSKTKLTEKEITQLEQAELSGYLALTRDLFLFSYYCKGARFENCITMQNKFIKDGRVTFRTNKGRKVISVLIHAKLKAIIDRYKSDSFFLFPVILPKDIASVLKYYKDPTNKELKLLYTKIIDRRNSSTTTRLNKVCKAAGIKRVTFHEARHSLAYNLKRKGVPTSAITDTLGQSSVRITEIYLKTLDDEYLDNEVAKLYGE